MTHLTFINRAFDLCRPDIVFFYKDRCRPQGEVIAWKVVHRCGIDWSHPFAVSDELELTVIDADGNHSPRISVRPSMSFELNERSDRGRQWEKKTSEHPSSIEVRNSTQAAVGCLLTRDGRAVVPIHRLAADTGTTFQIDRDLWVGAVRKAQEGEPLGPFELKVSTTRLDLEGVQRGEVCMTGGGMGASALPYSFHLRRAG